MNKIRQGCNAVHNGIKNDSAADNSIFKNKMGTFSERADRACEEAVASLEQAETEFASLCEYFASPPPPVTTPDTFFKLVADFVRVYTQTVKSATARKERQAKQAEREAARNALKMKATSKVKKMSKDQRVPHKRALTGIDMTSIANAAAKSVKRDGLNYAEEDLAPPAPASKSQTGFDEVSPAVVLKAMRRASNAMNIPNH